MHDDWNISPRVGARRSAGEPWWEERVDRRDRELLDLPAPRQPGAAPSCASWSCSTRCARPTTPGRCCASSPTAPTTRPRGRAGATTATGDRVRAGRDRLARRPRARRRAPRRARARAGRWSTTTSGSGSSSRRAATSTTCVLATSLPFAMLPRPSRPGGVERGGLRRRVGRSASAGWASAPAAPLDLEAWAAFQDSFHRVARLLADVAPAAAARRRRASCRARRRRPPRLPRRARVPRATAAPAAASWQAVCSPFRNTLDPARAPGAAVRLVAPGRAVGRALARLGPRRGARSCAGA